MSDEGATRSMYTAVVMLLDSKDKDDAERVLYPTNSRTCLQKLPVVGGSPVTPEKAKMLRQKVFGAASLVGPVETDWLNQSFCFHPHDSPLGYGLKVAKGITKGFIMCVQGFVLKNLLFGRRRLSVGVEPRNLLKTTVRAQEDALVEALADVLWQAGGRTGAFLCLTQENVYLTTDEDYQCDGCTERLHIFEYSKQDELRFNVKKYLYEFMSTERCGLLCFLYSLIMTRGFKRLEDDLGDVGDVGGTLLQHNGSIQPTLAALILTGRASPFLHNGIIYEGSEDTMAKPKTGVLIRAQVGLLVWQRSDGNRQVAVGSRLKTPSLPIWVTRCNGSYGVLFNPNRELLRDYHAENRFNLYYYSCSSNHPAPTLVTIDARTPTATEEFSAPDLENLIHTKWNDATVTWNGTMPYV